MGQSANFLPSDSSALAIVQKLRWDALFFHILLLLFVCSFTFCHQISTNVKASPKRNRVNTKKQNWTRKKRSCQCIPSLSSYWGLDHMVILVILSPQQGHQGNSQKVEGNCNVSCCLCHKWKSCAYDIDMHEHQILDFRIGNKTGQKGKNIQQR